MQDPASARFSGLRRLTSSGPKIPPYPRFGLNPRMSCSSQPALAIHDSAPLKWGDFSERATSANIDHRSDRNAAEPDRSEIGPYLGGHWATSRSPATNPTSPSRVPATNSTLPERLRDGAISPKAPRPQTWTTAVIGTPRSRTARRSVPTSEVIGLNHGVLLQTQPQLTSSGEF